jgi:hypothetical protein
MSTTTLPRSVGTNHAPRVVSPPDGLDPGTDEGLRHAVRAVGRSGLWDRPAGRRLLDEIRKRAVRNAAHVATATGVAMDRGLVDDVLLAAWMVLHRHGDKVLAAERPWAYLMSSAQKNVLDEVRAQQLLTNPASIRGRAREVLPAVVRPVGTTSSDLAAAFRHESRGENADDTERQVVAQIGRHSRAPLVAPPMTATGDEQPARREAWFAAFIDLLGDHGADPTGTAAAVDRLADLFAVSYVGWWEWAARRDPILAKLGLSPDQCGALVALLAGSRQYRHNGKKDSLLAAVRTATESGCPVQPSGLQRRRIAAYTGQPAAARPTAPSATVTSQRDGRALATTGV